MDVLATVLSTLAGGPKQFDRLLHLHTPLGPDVLVAENLDGVEALAPSVDAIAGFRLQLTALSVDAHLDLAALLGQPVRLELQTADSIGAPRALHGHVTAFERLGSNGGLARYRLVVEPWLALLRDRVDSYVFQDMSVVEILEDLFADYVPGNGSGQGKLAPAWRWDLADPAVYRKRSLTTQYEESDLAFVERLLADEGLFYWFEHEGNADGDSLGAHTMVIADHNDAFADLGTVRYHRSDATERDDSIQQFAATRRWQTGRLQRASWDYRRLDTRATEADADVPGAVIAADIDTAGLYAWPGRVTGERFARQQLEALQVTRDTVDGAGTWRQLQPGGRFALSQHPAYGVDAEGESTNRFHCLRLHHRARNNLGAEILAQVEQQLGLADLSTAALPASLHAANGSAAKQADPPSADFYQNTFAALPAAVPYRAQTTDGHGLRLHPKPSVSGTQTAIVVTDGAPLQTDRDHRIKVQFPWQRGANASHRQPHPAGGDNAPGTDTAWTWVRVAAPWAGDNWGSVLLPRRGQEVVVAFLEGDIDRPVVVGSVYNGRGQMDAPHNQASGGAANATGNAPAWFDGNAHNAVFTGFKSQALSASQSGNGGYQQLRLDDTPGQGRAQASTTQHATTLSLGHLKGGKDNVRDGERGFGVELSTAASGAVRGGSGLLLSTERGRAQLDADGARAQLDSGRQLLASLAEVAKAQGADLPDEAAPLPADDGRKTLGEALAATASGGQAGQGVGGGTGDAPGWSAPALVASSPDGIASVTPADQVWVSGTTITLDAGADLQWLSQGETVIAAEKGIAMYAHGSEPPAGKPNTETGIALHAAQGAVSARAASATAEVAAQVSVTIASTTADVQLAAPNKHLLATAAGAYLKLEGDNIELGAPGTIEFKAAKKEWTSAQSATLEAPSLAKGKLTLCDFKMQSADIGGDGPVPVDG
ncbi:type VI secretion system tip protein TssI/VgrG [Lysobacter sp. F6437]|uniref:type VI secretion system tip protein TssI/VgrG n=1 Tax=Lysobacter sp. F6437 TaxID=3459296 RepID=UPI00403DBF83